MFRYCIVGSCINCKDSSDECPVTRAGLIKPKWLRELDPLRSLVGDPLDDQPPILSDLLFYEYLANFDQTHAFFLIRTIFIYHSQLQSKFSPWSSSFSAPIIVKMMVILYPN
jgi:hypothetical protein